MKKLIYTMVAFSFVVTAHSAQASVACGSSTGVARDAKTKYKVSELVGKKGTRATVKRTNVTK